MPRNEMIDDLLSKHLSLSADELQQVTAYWRDECSANEALEDFLSRQGVLTREAPRAMQLMRKGYLQFSHSASLLADQARERLREKLAARQRSAEVASILSQFPDKDVTEQALRNTDPLALGDTLSAPPPDAAPPPTPGHSQSLQQRTVMTSSITSTSASFGGRGEVKPGTPAWPLRSGMVLGKYLLTDLVGQGSSGLVFRGLNQKLNLSVAVKVLRRTAEESVDPRVLRQLQNEACLLASLNHPYVVRLWDFETDPQLPYLVMEYVEGLSMAELLQQCGRMSLARAVELIFQVVEGLAAIWKLNIVHRDIKPDNILVTRDGTPKIADLGLALVVDQSLGGTEADGKLAGTAAYMAPEQGLLGNGEVDPRADIYSLGVTFYQAVTGSLPFNARSPREMLHHHAYSTPKPPAALVADLPPAVSEVIMTMMQRDPENRYQDADELFAALLPLGEMTSAGTGTKSAPFFRSKAVTRTNGMWNRPGN